MLIRAPGMALGVHNVRAWWGQWRVGRCASKEGCVVDVGAGRARVVCLWLHQMLSELNVAALQRLYALIAAVDGVEKQGWQGAGVDGTPTTECLVATA